MTDAVTAPTRRLGLGAMLITLVGLFALGAGGMTSNAAVGDQAHFRATFDAPSASVVEIIQQAQSADYWVRVQTGTDVTYFKGSQPCPSCDPANEREFFQRPQLIADGQMIWMRLTGETWELNLRPTPEGAGTYALLVSPLLPKAELTDEMLSEIGDALAPFDLLPSSPSSLDFSAYSQPSDPQPPQGVNLTSALYGFLNAPDWAEASSERGVPRSGLRAVVDVELGSSSTELPSGLDLIVESRSGATARVQALIPQLDDLAQAASVRNVQSSE